MTKKELEAIAKAVTLAVTTAMADTTVAGTKPKTTSKKGKGKKKKYPAVSTKDAVIRKKAYLKAKKAWKGEWTNEAYLACNKAGLEAIGR
jgi:hypothetical protein